VGQMPVPNTHPALALMLMSKGGAPPTPGQLTFGRDVASAHVVLNHPNVSARHATVQLSPLAVTDHGSTAGTWHNRNRLPAEQPVPVDPHALLALGAVPVPLQLVLQLGQVLGAGAPAAAGPGGPAPVPLGVDPGARETPRKKHKTVIGQI